MICYAVILAQLFIMSGELAYFGSMILEQADLSVVACVLWLAWRALERAAEAARGATVARADAERARAAPVPVEGRVAAVGALHGATAVALQPAHDARHTCACAGHAPRCLAWSPLDRRKTVKAPDPPET